VIFKSTINITVGSTPAPGSVSLTPTSLNFGTQNVGATSTPQNATLSNSTSAAVAISSITTTSDYAQTNTCGSSLAAGASCSIAVTYAPSAAGTDNGSLTVTAADAGSPHIVSLNGSGGSTSPPPPPGPCTMNPDNQTVTICTPANGAVVASPVHIVADTTDSNPVNLVQIYVDGAARYTAFAGRLDTSLAMTPGAHRLTVQARDTTRLYFKSTINITVR